jgi:hypothetical protein
MIHNEFDKYDRGQQWKISEDSYNNLLNDPDCVHLETIAFAIPYTKEGVLGNDIKTLKIDHNEINGEHNYFNWVIQEAINVRDHDFVKVTTRYSTYYLLADSTQDNITEGYHQGIKNQIWHDLYEHQQEFRDECLLRNRKRNLEEL